MDAKWYGDPFYWELNIYHCRAHKIDITRKLYRYAIGTFISLDLHPLGRGILYGVLRGALKLLVTRVTHVWNLHASGPCKVSRVTLRAGCRSESDYILRFVVLVASFWSLIPSQSLTCHFALLLPHLIYQWRSDLKTSPGWTSKLDIHSKTYFASFRHRFTVTAKNTMVLQL